MGWGPKRRFALACYLPADVYEAAVAKNVAPGCAWIDIGAGRAIFPENDGLARELAARCSTVVGVDPDENILANPFVHIAFHGLLEDFRSDRTFDLATLRMVVEHVADPGRLLRALQRLVRPGGRVIVLTVNRWSPSALTSRITPHALHYPVKKLLWGGEERDTFPVQYRMNTKRTLRGLFSAYQFDEVAFAYVDDLSICSGFKHLNAVELTVWSLFRGSGIRYPENCLLGIYQRRSNP
jgi:SAM-dependent methyltransferase